MKVILSPANAATQLCIMSRERPVKNKSEMLLEGYLRSYGCSDFDFEPEIPGTSKRPDYRLRWGGGEILLEVKEFRAEPNDLKPGGGFFDPYHPLREKINTARNKFKHLKQHCCCLVVYNVDKPLILLDWQHIYGAMLGNLGFSIPLHIPGRPAPSDDDVKSVFLSGGKMHQERGGVVMAPQNQTISAIIVLGRVAAGERLFQAYMRDREAQDGRRMELEELFRELELAPGTPRDPRRRPLRVVVHENPYARIPLSSHLFRGPWDERYGGLEGRVQRLFEGTEVAKLPTEV
jgi:hypothetical protein